MSAADISGSIQTNTGMRPWQFVLWFGTVSLLADFVYEGARSVPSSAGVPGGVLAHCRRGNRGPPLRQLLQPLLRKVRQRHVVGRNLSIDGDVGSEAAALGLRLVSGPLTSSPLGGLMI
ncbi:hypothetical protein [Streptomyces sp. AcE210]|uniref:hypothetical protein n=1 Tax=Streptomyces sp. AcE210 TaxID=2292703 RepID=UPI0019D09AAD|nr:hypothetical protein [Streptomyces sp. AcE210]